MNSFTTSYPPSVNHYKKPVIDWRRKKFRMVLTSEARTFVQETRLHARLLEPLDGDVAIRVDIYRPCKSGDLDNRIKVLLDSLEGCGYHNDKQVTEIHAYRHDDKHNPRAEITVSQVIPTDSKKPTALPGVRGARRRRRALTVQRGIN